MNKFKNLLLCICIMTAVALTGCGGATETDKNEKAGQTDSGVTNNSETNQTGSGVPDSSDVIETGGVGLDDETALDGNVDFAALQAENEDVIAWLQVPGTNIDYPILQSWEEDDYYATRNAHKQDDKAGALYIEMANMPNMCDFNTVIHGNGTEGLFGELVNYTNPDFFGENEEFYIYLDGNVLKYEIWAAFERDNTSLIRDYDFSYIEGCKDFLNDVYNSKIMGKQIREGWEDVSEYHFLVTLTVDNPDSDKQLVVIGALVYDAAGTIDRMILE